MSLFIEDYDLPQKRCKTWSDESDDEQSADLEVDSDSDSDWETVPLPQDNYDITIKLEDSGTLARKRLVAQRIKERRRRVSLHSLGMLVYMLHGKTRNAFLSSKRVAKALKKLLPKTLKDHVKELKTSEHNDVLLMYIVQYVVKWFRLNFNINSNGLRVLGFVQDTDKAHECFPHAAPPIASVKDFLKVIGKFAHNRDTGAQILTAIFRSLGFNARMVFSLPLVPTKKGQYQPNADYDKFATNKDNDLLYPYFWTELVNPLDESEIIVVEACCFHNEEKRITRLGRYGGRIEKSWTSHFYPVQDLYNRMNMQYVVAFDNDGLAIDVSSRYMKNVAYRWFSKLDMKMEMGKACLLYQNLLRYFNKRLSYPSQISQELSHLRKVALSNNDIPTSFASMKRSPNFTTESTLRYNEVLGGKVACVGHVKLNGTPLKVYYRDHVTVGKSETQWKFLGRSIKPTEIHNPIKLTTSLVPKTIHHRRIYNDNIRNNQPHLNNVKLYSFSQTCPYHRMEISNGQLPKNRFGNIEVFHNCMVPNNCTWLKLANIEKILSDHNRNMLSSISEQISFVPVVVGFRFTAKSQAIPVKEGVIVHDAQSIKAKQIWLYGKIEEDKKQRQKIFQSWNHFLSLLRIKNRLDEDYGKLE